jgi:hypothetical protein
MRLIVWIASQMIRSLESLMGSAGELEICVELVGWGEKSRRAYVALTFCGTCS